MARAASPSADPATDRLDRLVVAVGRSRDMAAFRELFDEVAPRLKGFMLGAGFPEAQAEDLAQDVLVAVWNKAAGFDPARANALTWIFAIARNRRTDALRRARTATREIPSDLPEAPSPEEKLDVARGIAAVGPALDALPEAQRRALLAAFVEGKSFSELAEAEGIPIGTMKSRVRLALNRLRAELGGST